MEQNPMTHKRSHSSTRYPTSQKLMATTPVGVASQSPPRALLLPFPAQGHVIPLMDLAHRLACSGVDVTFVNTEYDNARLLASAASPPAPPPPGQATGGGIRVATVPDGLGPNDSRNDIGRLCNSLLQSMPARLEQLILEEGEAGYPVTCVVADGCMAWALDVAGKFGLPAAIMWPASAEILAKALSIPRLIQDGILDDIGMPTNNEPYHLIPGAPPLCNSDSAWAVIEDPAARRSMFQYFYAVARFMEKAKFVICNSFLELEHPAFAFAPHILPIGPDLRDNSTTASFGRSSFWAEDRDCLRWLDSQPHGSVVYVSFGSLATLGPRQFQELALGLELSGRPFLWVVRRDLVIDGGCNQGALCYPFGFKERVFGRGMTVEWAPQREVLAHPAVACFLSHCGWNSIMEGVGNGVPFLCWPYFLDQIPNSEHVCDVWRNGIRVAPDGDGLVHREQVKEKLDTVLGDEGIRARALELKETARRNMEPGGVSQENYNRFVDAMRKQSGVVSRISLSMS